MTGNAPVAEFGALLVGVNRLVRRALWRGLTGPRLRGAQVELLRLVRGAPGLRVSAAARQLGLAGNSVSTLVRQLVALGLLERSPDPRDGRAALLTLTPEAEDRLRAWEDRRTALLAARFAALAPAEREALVAALPALRALAKGLHEEVTEP
ncbi:MULTISPECIES: MarR family transcriptional regulator [unclassified Streptomyces]|uniref:MarR family winged helix-turn-helix transcriptional regulator n=1 Tax=unclassified Streptomyces TaxID=2593676 RepID=UPI00332DC849